MCGGVGVVLGIAGGVGDELVVDERGRLGRPARRDPFYVWRRKSRRLLRLHMEGVQKKGSFTAGPRDILRVCARTRGVPAGYGVPPASTRATIALASLTSRR